MTSLNTSLQRDTERHGSSLVNIGMIVQIENSLLEIDYKDDELN